MKEGIERQSLKAVCFDYKGVILDHRPGKDMVPGMMTLLEKLKDKGLKLALISRFPREILLGEIGALKRFFGDHVYSGGGRGKLTRIREFADNIGVHDLSRVAFVDDKPSNILPASRESDVFVIGFKGSGKYPESRDVCVGNTIPFAEDVDALHGMLIPPEQV